MMMTRRAIFNTFFVSFFIDMSFQCLGSWPGENGETYMSLLDTKLPQLGEEPRPRYRCAVSFFSFTIIKTGYLYYLKLRD